MKQLPIIIVLLISSTALSQNQKTIISDSQNKYQVIKELINSNSLRQYHTEYTYNTSSKNGSLTFYYNGNELKNILHTYTSGHITYRDEFYIWDGQLFFQLTTHTIRYKDYKKKRFIKKNLKNITLTLEDYFYFKDRKLIECQFKNFQNSGIRVRKIKADQIRNTSTECDKANNVLKKFDLLKSHQEKNVKNAIDLPKGISKTYALF